MSAYSQLVNLLKGPGYDAQSPFPEVTKGNPCPQYMLVTNTVAGAYTISNVIPLPGQDPVTTGGATAQCAVYVEYWSGNCKRSALLYTSQSLTTIQTAIG